MYLVVSSRLNTWLTFASLALFGLGLLCLLTQRNVIKQVVGLKIMLQGVILGLMLAGHLQDDVRFAQAMVISALIVEAVIIVVALALIVNVFRHYPSGDVDDLRRLWG
jgi:NADH-quinone oxidoreductase subunit K